MSSLHPSSATSSARIVSSHPSFVNMSSSTDLSILSFPDRLERSFLRGARNPALMIRRNHLASISSKVDRLLNQRTLDSIFGGGIKFPFATERISSISSQAYSIARLR